MRRRLPIIVGVLVAIVVAVTVTVFLTKDDGPSTRERFHTAWLKEVKAVPLLSEAKEANVYNLGRGMCGALDSGASPEAVVNGAADASPEPAMAHSPLGIALYSGILGMSADIICPDHNGDVKDYLDTLPDYD